MVRTKIGRDNILPFAFLAVFALGACGNVVHPADPDAGETDAGAPASIPDAAPAPDDANLGCGPGLATCDPGYVCDNGSCEQSVCGDGIVDASRNEQCDDSNDIDGDGCTQCRHDCQTNAECDDGNPCNGVEMCNGSCQLGSALTAGETCTTPAVGTGQCRTFGAAMVCVSTGCGNGQTAGGEHCDDGNEIAGDGCEIDCRYSCVTNSAVANTWYADCDGDGHVTSSAMTSNSCFNPGTPSCGGQWILHATQTNDCNDSCPTCNPSASETCDGLDNNCVGGADEVASCNIACNWDGKARWLSHGWDGGGAFGSGAWVSCMGGMISDMEWKSGSGVATTPSPSGTADMDVGCNWTGETWASQGIDGGGAWASGSTVTCTSNRVSAMTWETNSVTEQAAKPGHLACNWSGAIFLSHGWDGGCAFSTGYNVTCNNNQITHMEWVEGCARGR